MTNTKQLEKKINKVYKKGNVKSAIELCQIGLQDDPTNADLHVRLGHPQRRRSAECTEPAGGGAYGASDDPAGRKQKESIYAETLQCDAAS